MPAWCILERRRSDQDACLAHRGFLLAARLPQRFMLKVHDLFRQSSEHAPGGLMLAYGVHIAVKGVEEHVRRAQALQAFKSVWTWSSVPSPATRCSSGSGVSVRRSRMRGHSAGSGLPSAAASCCKRGSPVSRNQSIRMRIGCQASPYWIARRKRIAGSPHPDWRVWRTYWPWRGVYVLEHHMASRE